MTNHTTKVCTACKRELPATREWFYGDKRAQDGLYPCCKPCFLERAKRSRYKDIKKTRARELASYYRHHEKRLIRGKHYREENSEKNRVRHAKYYRENKAKIQQYQRENPGIWKRNTKRWRQRNPERARMLARLRAHERRAQIRNRGGFYTPEDIQIQIRMQTDSKGRLICWWCDKPIKGKYHVDHRIPVSRGGANNARNICITHCRCNQSKNDKLPHEWNGRLL